jgi:hypothetical protein
MQSCFVNGKRYVFADGASISIINDKVYCNGKVVIDTNDIKDKVINITIKGNVEKASTGSGSLEIKGDVCTVQSASGNISIVGNVSGDVTTSSGDVKCGDVLNGNVKTMSGDVTCGVVNGDVSTMSGDVEKSVISRISKTIGNVFSGKGNL